MEANRKKCGGGGGINNPFPHSNEREKKNVNMTEKYTTHPQPSQGKYNC